jgi:hypothetical protein
MKASKSEVPLRSRISTLRNMTSCCRYLTPSRTRTARVRSQRAKRTSRCGRRCTRWWRQIARAAGIPTPYGIWAPAPAVRPRREARRCSGGYPGRAKAFQGLDYLRSIRRGRTRKIEQVAEARRLRRLTGAFWRLAALDRQRGVTPGRTRVAASMTVGSPWVWKALPTKSTSGLRKRCPGPLRLLGSRQGAHPGGWESWAAPAGQDWVNGLPDTSRVCVGLHVPRTPGGSFRC